jgi:hypothetical protein
MSETINDEYKDILKYINIFNINDNIKINDQTRDFYNRKFLNILNKLSIIPDTISYSGIDLFLNKLAKNNNYIIDKFLKEIIDNNDNIIIKFNCNFLYYLLNTIIKKEYNLNLINVVSFINILIGQTSCNGVIISFIENIINNLININDIYDIYISILLKNILDKKIIISEYYIGLLLNSLINKANDKDFALYNPLIEELYLMMPELKLSIPSDPELLYKQIEDILKNNLTYTKDDIIKMINYLSEIFPEYISQKTLLIFNKLNIKCDKFRLFSIPYINIPISNFNIVLIDYEKDFILLKRTNRLNNKTESIIFYPDTSCIDRLDKLILLNEEKDIYYKQYDILN